VHILLAYINDRPTLLVTSLVQSLGYSDQHAGVISCKCDKRLRNADFMFISMDFMSGP